MGPYDEWELETEAVAERMKEFLDNCAPEADPLPATAAEPEVNHPKHYVSHPSGVECITITEHMSFNLGNAIKYIWRASLKGKQRQDLEKAIWYLQRELRRLYP